MTMENIELEICCADLQSLRAAVDGGAQRVELCQALGLDGLTPSAGMIEMAVESGITTHVLIRPREGDFVYSPDEVECMVRDIRMARSLGAQGVVVGALTPDGDIDIPTCQRLAEEAHGMNITFHRAFDVCRQPMQALGQIYALGCNRLLTSGQAPKAEDGIPMLRQLVAEATRLSQQGDHRLLIMPGSGVCATNAHRILSETGACQIHGSLRKDGHTDAETVRQTIQNIRLLHT